MQSELISILVPFKNTSKFIDECVESILVQTHTNWELLIVNDHSLDTSYNQVLAYAEKDKRIKLFQNEGHGIIPALRKAYSESIGNFITRMDSDDLMHPQKLELMLKDLKTHGNKHVALGQVSYFRDDGIGQGYKAYENWLNRLTKNGTNYNDIYKECVIPSPCWMMRKNDLDLCQAFNPNSYPEDYDLTFRFYENKMRCIPSNHVLHFWRDHKSRASRTDQHYAENSFLELKVSYFLKLDYDNQRPLVIRGAGQKGKKIARLFSKLNIEFKWVCDNHKKIGKHIYDVELEHFSLIKNLQLPQVIVAVANAKEQQEIIEFFEVLNMKSKQDYFFFC